MMGIIGMSASFVIAHIYRLSTNSKMMSSFAYKVVELVYAVIMLLLSIYVVTQIAPSKNTSSTDWVKLASIVVAFGSASLLLTSALEYFKVITPSLKDNINVGVHCMLMLGVSIVPVLAAVEIRDEMVTLDETLDSLMKKRFPTPVKKFKGEFTNIMTEAEKVE